MHARPSFKLPTKLLPPSSFFLANTQPPPSPPQNFDFDCRSLTQSSSFLRFFWRGSHQKPPTVAAAAATVSGVEGRRVFCCFADDPKIFLFASKIERPNFPCIRGTGGGCFGIKLSQVMQPLLGGRLCFSQNKTLEQPQFSPFFARLIPGLVFHTNWPYHVVIYVASFNGRN